MRKKSSRFNSSSKSSNSNRSSAPDTPEPTPDIGDDPESSNQTNSDPAILSVLQRTQSESEPVGALAVASSSASAAGPSTEEAASSEGNKDDSGAKEGKTKKNRCHTCKKKVGLTGKESPSLRRHSILFSSSILPDYVATSRYYF